MKKYRIFTLEYGGKYIVNMSEPNSPIIEIALVQSTDSLRASFLKCLLAKRKLIRRFRFLIPISDYEAFDDDYRLLKLANEIPANSSIWQEVIAKFEQGASTKEILDFLKLAIIAERLK